MTRVRDNADLLSGGKTIEVEPGNAFALRVKNTSNQDIFEIEEDGSLFQDYNDGVILLSDKGGIKVDKNGNLYTTHDGGITWRAGCEGGGTDPTDPTLPPGVDPTEKIGELEDGTPVTYELEYSGELHDRVYIPTAANPKTIICSIGRPETIQPGCCSREPDPLIIKCAEEGQPGYGTDFPYDTTWCVRLPFNSDASNPNYPSPVIYFYTRETGDELGTYNLSVSRNPGDFNVPDTDKKMNTPTWSCYLYTGDDWQAGGAKPYSLQELGTPGQKMIYVNVQPTGSRASKCGSLIYNNPDGSIACRMYIAAWPSTSNPNDLPDLEDPR